MVGSGGDLSRPKTQMTDFTIDCILSKSERTENRASNQPITLNKVLNNNPWIPISPIAHFFNPSSIHKKFPLPNLFCPTSATIENNIIENLIKATENRHTQIVQNHFYASPHVFTLESSHTLPPKSIVYEKIFCDNHNQNSHNDDVDESSCVPLSIFDEVIENKCKICSKLFDHSDLLDVSLLKKFKTHNLKNFIRFT